MLRLIITVYKRRPPYTDHFSILCISMAFLFHVPMIRYVFVQLGVLLGNGSQLPVKLWRVSPPDS